MVYNRLITRCLCSAAILSWIAISSAMAQGAGDYRTAHTGNWNDASTWDRFNGTSWVAAPSAPIVSDGEITIRSGHVITIPNGVTVSADQIVVQEDLVIATGGQLTLADGTGTDLTLNTAQSLLDVSGVLLRGDLTTISNQSVITRIQFRAGSQYRHNYTATFGDLPQATWNPSSTIIVQGFTTTSSLTADNSWAQSVGHFIFNAPGQKGLVDFAGNLTTFQGNVSIQNTGTNVLQFSSSQNPTVTVSGDFSLSGASRFNLATTGSGTSLSVGGNFINNSTNNTGSNFTISGTSVVNIGGNFSMSAGAGRLHLASTGTSGNTTINLQGNFTLTSGRIDEIGTDPTQGTINFLGAGTRTFTNTGSITGRINYNISSSTILDAGTSGMIGSTGSTFTLNGTLIVRSLASTGAINSSTTSGNVRTPPSGRTYAPGSIVIYAGAGPQFIAPAQPQGTGVTTIIDNTNGVTLTNNVTINGNLILQSGDLSLGNFRLTSGGTFSSPGGELRGTALSSLFILGTTGGSWGTIVFDPSAAVVGVVVLGRTGPGATVDLNSTVLVDSLLQLNSGTFNNQSGLTFADGAEIVRYSDAFFAGAEPLSAGTYNVTYRSTSSAFADFDTGPELPTNPNILGDLNIRMGRVTDLVNLANDITVNGSLTLTIGSLVAGNHIITLRSDWNDNSGTFVAETSTVRIDGNVVVGGSSATTFNNLEMTAAGTAQFLRNFSVSGNLSFAAGSTFDMGTQTATFTGSNVQQVSVNGASLYNVTVSKSGGGMQLTSALNLLNVLQFTTSNINVQSNGFLTLVSTSDAAGNGTASIYRLQNGNTVTGNITVQRFMSGEGRIYRYISSPVSGAMISQWKDDFDITGPFLDPSPRRLVCGVTTNPASYSLFYYNEAVAGDIDQGYIGYPLPGNATTNSPIVVGRGYAAHIRECSNPTVIDVTGPINFNLASLPVTYTVNTPLADGWNLVGNPFPCTIDWDAGSWTKTRIASVISITDNGSGMIRYYDAGISNDIPNGQIAIGQAFFVRATAANPSLIVRENTKVLNTAEFFREATPDRLPAIALNFYNNVEHDRTYLKIQEGAHGGLDDFDAPKLKNPLFNFSFVDDSGHSMAIHAIGELPAAKEFRLLMENVEENEYTIALEIDRQFFNDRHFVLRDHYLNKSLRMKRGESYTFAVSSDARSADPYRFSFTIQEGVEETSEDYQSVVAYPNPIGDDLTVDVTQDDVVKIQFATLLGQVQSEIVVDGQVKQYDIDFSRYAKGVYLMIVHKRNSKQSIRLFKE